MDAKPLSAYIIKKPKAPGAIRINAVNISLTDQNGNTFWKPINVPYTVLHLGDSWTFSYAYTA